MNTLKNLAMAGLVAAGCLAGQQAQAQSTDGYHTIQVIPVAVDTSSFAQKFNFRNPNSSAINVSVRYLPGTGTTQAPTSVSCTTQNVAANSDKAVNGLRSLCPGIIAGGSQFGMLYMFETSPTLNLPFAVFSRVANPQGNGFTVEGFPAHTFTSADATVIGVRRAAASLSNPQYQTNCFIGNMYPYNANTTVSNIFVSVFNSAGAQLGATTQVDVTPGQFVRMLDVFAFVGAPAGDYDNARVQFSESGTGEPGIIAFCTTQESTTFGADFRIAKQEYVGASGNQFGSIGSHDMHVSRDNQPSQDILMSPAFGAPAVAVTRNFVIPIGTTANTHVMYFRHPDWIFCEVINPTTGLRADVAYGLEMRMLDKDGLTVLFGGNDSTGFGPVYLGNKELRNDGANSRYTIEVESSGGTPDNTNRPYRLHCQSGSGHTGGDIVRYQDPNRF